MSTPARRARGLARAIGIGEVNKPATVWMMSKAKRLAALRHAPVVLDQRRSNIHLREGR
jgi:hypothetical protein